MGLKRDNSAVYLSIFEGKIVQRVKNPSETSRERINKENEKVYEEVYGSISGKIIGLSKSIHEKYGTSLLVYIEDDKIYCLQFLFDGQYGVSFLKTLPNVDLSKPVELIPNQKEENGKTRQTIFVKQDGNALKFAFTKENPNGLPDAKQVKYQGEMKWDFFDQTQFLHDTVFIQAKDFLQQKGYKHPEPEQEQEEDTKEDKPKGGKKKKNSPPGPGDDDLPF